MYHVMFRYAISQSYVGLYHIMVCHIQLNETGGVHPTIQASIGFDVFLAERRTGYLEYSQSYT
jgi:hypothetical protein